MNKKKRIAVFVLLLITLVCGYVLIQSSTIEKLENKIITTSDIKIEVVGQYQFGIGGMALVGQNVDGDGVFQAYAKIPVLNRYMKTYEVSFISEEQPLYIAGESWDGYQALIYQDGKLNNEDSPSGLGFAGRIPLWITLSALTSFLITYGPTTLRNTRKRKENK
jgi:hypothetical protein